MRTSPSGRSTATSSGCGASSSRATPRSPASTRSTASGTAGSKPAPSNGTLAPRPAAPPFQPSAGLSHDRRLSLPRSLGGRRGIGCRGAAAVGLLRRGDYRDARGSDKAARRPAARDRDPRLGGRARAEEPARLDPLGGGDAPRGPRAGGAKAVRGGHPGGGRADGAAGLAAGGDHADRRAAGKRGAGGGPGQRAPGAGRGEVPAPGERARQVRARGAGGSPHGASLAGKADAGFREPPRQRGGLLPRGRSGAGG